MRCPNCASEVPPGSTCPRCGAPLTALPSAAALSAGPDSVPLTLVQKARLIVECVPLLFFVLAFIFSATILDDIVGAPPPVALLLFLGFVILVVG